MVPVRSRVGAALFLLVGALVVAGDSLGQPWMMRAALIVIGLIACVGGIRAILRRDVRGGFSGANYRERLTGASARLMGLFLILAGVIVAGLAGLDLWTGGEAQARLRDLVVDSPQGAALVLGLAGAFVSVFGLVRWRSGSAREGGPFAPHIEWSFRAFGLAATVMGAAMMVVAVAWAIAPDRMYDGARRVSGAVLRVIANP